ncbi:MAG TPA: hypothetical protein VFB77_04490, partial [Acidimicrobiales bacterium]|nr:hypothetical protein [Acidimicrobiales bacterium]
MAKHRVKWLTRRAAIGVKDLPTTAAANATGSSVASALSQAGRSIAEHMPFTGGETSVEALINEARTAAEEAREAEARAVALAQESRHAAVEAKR